jgi:hypothetical protein
MPVVLLISLSIICKILKGNFMLEYGLLSQNHLILPIKNCLQQHEVFISSKISSMEQIESQIESVASKY